MLGSTLFCSAACQEAVPAPANYPPVIDSLEVFSEAQVREIFDRYPDLFYGMNVSLQHAAAMALHPLMASTSIRRPYPNDPTRAWPRPVDQITNRFYFDYAVEHRRADMGFGAFFITHMEGNPTVCPPADTDIILGYTFGYGPNTVASDPVGRATFLFAEDAAVIANSCGVNAQNTFIGLLTHEMGHQRAGLTHPEEFNYQALYHTGTVPSGRTDIMAQRTPLNVMARWRYPRFDAKQPFPPSLGDESACSYNLFHARPIGP